MRHVNPAVATQLMGQDHRPEPQCAPDVGDSRGVDSVESGVDSVEAIQPGDFAYLPADVNPQNANYAEGYVLLLYELE